MMRTLPTAILLMIALTLAASAQRTPPRATEVLDSLTDLHDTLQVIPRNMVTVNPGGIIADYLNVAYYRALNRNDALGIYAGYIYRPIGAETVKGSMIGIAYRRYPGDRALWRFYYGPIVSYQQFNLFDDARLTASGVSLGGTLGWQWFPDGDFAVGLGVGVQYLLGGGDITNGVMQRMFGIRPVMTFDLGYAW